MGGKFADSSFITHQVTAAPIPVGSNDSIVNNVAACVTAVMSNVEYISFAACLSSFERRTGTAGINNISFNKTLITVACKLQSGTGDSENLVIDHLGIFNFSVEHNTAGTAVNSIVANDHIVSRCIDPDILSRKKSHVEIFPDNIAAVDHNPFAETVNSGGISGKRHQIDKSGTITGTARKIGNELEAQPGGMLSSQSVDIKFSVAFVEHKRSRLPVKHIQRIDPHIAVDLFGVKKHTDFQIAD